MKIISGASGFLGKAIASNDHRNSIGLMRKLPKNKPNFNVEEIDLADRDKTRGFINTFRNKQMDIEAFIHCAATTPWQKDPDFSKDIVMAKNVASICNELSIPKLIFTSGWVVYDSNSQPPYKEDTTPASPTTLYGMSKIAIEHLLKDTLKKTSVVNLRLASVYGPGQLSAGLIPNLTEKALIGRDLELNARNTKRDYLYISDLLTILNRVSNLKLDDHIDINVGSGEAYSVQEVAKTIVAIAKSQYLSNSEINFSSVNEGLPLDNTLSIDRAKRLGIIDSSLTSLYDGLVDYMKWVNDEHNL